MEALTTRNRIKNMRNSLALVILLSTFAGSRLDSAWAQTSTESKFESMQRITLGAGCFWCVEAVFDQLQGVQSVQSGYMGGTIKNPAYREVCTGRTGHAEVVQITFDPDAISIATILDVFFTVHDPTTLNRQGADVGSQYRSAIFFHESEQRQAAVESKNRAQGLWKDPIVTEIAEASVFYKAEDYHQSYYELNGEAPYCRAVIQPKMEKFQKTFAPLLKAD